MIKPYNKAEITFDILEEIGHEGKNSKVYIVHDHNMDARLVIKKVPKATISDTGEYFRESKVLYMSSHPNVVPIHYACEDADAIYIAMPHHSRGSLNNLMNSRYLTIREIVVYGCQFISGVHNIHSKGLIHFDIKPDNVLISDSNEAVLSDFGLATRTNFAGIAGQDGIYGKIRPPEALDYDHFSYVCDIYQIGLTLYRMCNGNNVFYSQFSKYGDVANFDRTSFRFDLRNGRFPDRGFFLHHVPEKLRKIIKKCLETDPDKRYQSVIEVSNALAEIDGLELDWQYIELPDKISWEKQTDGNWYCLEIDGDGNSLAKKRTPAGRETRISDYCVKAIPPKQIRDFLKTK